MSFHHPHFREYQDYLPVEAALWWQKVSATALALLTQPKYRHGVYGTKLSENLLIYPPQSVIKENILNGRKPKNVVNKSSGGNANASPFRWINVPLTGQDELILEQETADLEQLAPALIQLVLHGLGVSVKYDNARKSYNCSIYGSDNRNNMQPCGISGASSELRDAILVSLFRFNTCLQGSFDGCTLTDTAVQSKRFR